MHFPASIFLSVAAFAVAAGSVVVFLVDAAFVAHVVASVGVPFVVVVAAVFILVLVAVAVTVADAALLVAGHIDAVFAAVFPTLAATGVVVGHSAGEEGSLSFVPSSQPLSKHRGN